MEGRIKMRKLGNIEALVFYAIILASYGIGLLLVWRLLGASVVPLFVLLFVISFLLSFATSFLRSLGYILATSEYEYRHDAAIYFFVQVGWRALGILWVAYHLGAAIYLFVQFGWKTLIILAVVGVLGAITTQSYAKKGEQMISNPVDSL